MKRILTLALLFWTANLQAQTLSYMLPDAAAPGMAIYAELIGPNTPGNFGPDGLNNVSIEFINPFDALRVIVGPRVTSWDGRMVSLIFFILPGAPAGPVPFRVNIQGLKSNVDTFFIVQPQHLDPNILPGALGSGGSYGVRSRRNTLVVDSLILGSGQFTVSDRDPDPYTPGNQAYLPFTILSKGAVRIEGTLSVDGNTKDGIAGGGGGGARETTEGGNGFTGAGGMHGAGGLGSGGNHTSWNGGQSLNGAPGGGGLGDRWFDDQGGGGGTGFPFGTASKPGTWYQEGGNDLPGGVGGGSGGGERSDPDSSFGGGGGAFATAGGTSGTGGFNGGVPYGNKWIIPFCGGSGGGGGNQFGDGYAGVGGAGGGAIHIISFNSIEILGALTANGAAGEGTHGIFKGGGGGGGAGGAIALTAPFIYLNGYLSALGGKGGEAVLQPVRGGLYGGDGGWGRIRIIGLIGHSNEGISACTTPSVANVSISGETTYLSGTGNTGDSILVLAQTNGNWNYDTPIKAIVKEDGTWTAVCPLDIQASSSISILEQVHAPNYSPFVQEPPWVISPENLVFPIKPAGVSSQLDIRPLSITNSYFDGSNLHAQIAGSPLENLDVRLFDFLGREIAKSTVRLDGLGRTSWTLPGMGLSTGVYIITVTDNAYSTARTLSIVH